VGADERRLVWDGQAPDRLVVVAREGDDAIDGDA
jgi:hypothetical protein